MKRFKRLIKKTWKDTLKVGNSGNRIWSQKIFLILHLEPHNPKDKRQFQSIISLTKTLIIKKIEWIILS